jgi:hypothetical protein
MFAMVVLVWLEWWFLRIAAPILGSTILALLVRAVCLTFSGAPA